MNDLVTLAEAARRLGLSGSALHMQRQRCKDFPLPVQRKLYLMQDIIEFRRRQAQAVHEYRKHNKRGVTWKR